MSMCRVLSCVVGRGCLLWPVHSLGKIQLAFVLLYFVPQGQIFCYSKYLLASYLMLRKTESMRRRGLEKTWWLDSISSVQFSSVQTLSRVRLFATPCTAARQASLPITNSWSPPEPMRIESVMPSNHPILCRPLLLLPSIFPSIRVFSNESALRIRWPKYWSFSFNISHSNEHPGLISFRLDWLDLLAVQGTLKSLLQHHSSKASIFQHSDFFIVQFSHPYMTTGKKT